MKIHVTCNSMIVVLLLAGPAFASVQIPGLFNTGVNDSSALLSDMAVDPHYAITSTTASAYAPDDAYTYADLSALYAVYSGSWVGNTSTSQWIGPSSDIVGPFDPDWAGDYSYDLKFDLTGLDPNSAEISGEWSSDNGSEIFLNGVSTGIVKGVTGYGSLSSFSITSGFQAGVNTLTFLVNNHNEGSAPPLDPNPSGLQVNSLQGTAMVVPEAATGVIWSVLLIAAVGIACIRRRSPASGQ